MKNIPGFIKRLVKVLIAGAFTFTVAACYGIIMDYKFLINIKDISGAVIPDISLTLKQSGESIYQAYTDDEGYAMLYSTGGNGDPDFTVLIEDVDDTDNGGPYPAQEELVSGSMDGDVAEYTFTLSVSK